MGLGTRLGWISLLTPWATKRNVLTLRAATLICATIDDFVGIGVLGKLLLYEINSRSLTFRIPVEKWVKCNSLWDYLYSRITL